MVTTLPDLSRTAKALAFYDEQEPVLNAQLDAAVTNKQVELVLARMEKLGELVGAAFGEDTKAFNNPVTCRKTVRPGPAVLQPGFEQSFVRKMVAKWREQTGGGDALLR